MSSEILLAVGAALLVSAQMMYNILRLHLLLYGCRYVHRTSYDSVSLITAISWFVTGLTIFTIGSTIYASQNGISKLIDIALLVALIVFPLLLLQIALDINNGHTRGSI